MKIGQHRQNVSDLSRPAGDHNFHNSLSLLRFFLSPDLEHLTRSDGRQHADERRDERL